MMLTNKLRTLAALLVALTTLSTAQAQDNQQQDARLSVSAAQAEDREELIKMLDAAPKIRIVTRSTEGDPLKISDNGLRVIKLTDSGGEPASAERFTNYAMSGNFTLHNHSEKPVTGARLRFSNAADGQNFFVTLTNFSISPQEEYSHKIEFMTLAYDPAQLLAEVVGVQFTDTSEWGWGAFEVTPPLPPQPPPSEEVDARPRLLSRPRPNYTEEARRNKVVGTVRLQLEVGTDGAVGAVKVLNALPDGLTEEAIRVARRLKFQPATKNGITVVYRLSTDLEFDLR